MSTVDFTRAYIDRLCKEIGTRADNIYNAKTGAWYFSRGDSTIEVFLTNMEGLEDADRIFIRCFAPLCTVPVSPASQFGLFQMALELNSRFMGIKFGTLPGKSLLCVIAERDIEGMDYQEFVTMISDIGYWADHFDHYLQEHPGKL